ncbi:hypothetical protein AZ78_1094 [Lysobacter capsici AZ78]|uniref:Secreted protein n=1 Tax=Lysobacter capsici AZ78 TaxID=1444315 RepID=A0A120AFU1_9GAMM|nr:hypothetical protein AZ78_1094 [Lysobacter capsici AZ78]
MISPFVLKRFVATWLTSMSAAAMANPNRCGMRLGGARATRGAAWGRCRRRAHFPCARRILIRYAIRERLRPWRVSLWIVRRNLTRQLHTSCGVAAPLCGQAITSPMRGR